MINTFRTLFEARERKFQQERLFRGESVDLVARITTDGVMDTLNGYSISGVYQPTDELSGPFYPMDAEIVDGSAVLHWTNQNDFGKTAYNVWGLLTKDGNAAYPICWRLNMAHSPSYPLSSVDPIPRTIDFSQYDLLNTPWLPLSGGTISGDFVVQNFISGSNNGLFIGKNNRSSYQNYGIALGNNLSTNAGATAIGNYASAGNSDIVIGTSAKGSGGGNTAIGNNSYGTGASTAIGAFAKANGNNSIAIGNGAVANNATEVRLGGRQLTNQPSLWLFDTPIISGPDTSILSARLPYLSNYETKADAATEHQALSTDLTAYVEERIGEIPQPKPPTFSNLVLQNNGNTIATYNPNLSQDLSANFVIPLRVTDLIDDIGIATQSELDQLTATYETKQHASDTYQTKGDAVADLAFINGRVNAVANDLSTNYLPLSGGNVTGRISLKTSQSQVVGSNAVLTASDFSTIYVGSWDEFVELTANVTLSVMNAGQDFIDMISNSEEYTGEQLTSYTVNAKVQLVGPNGFNKTLNASATIGFGNCYVSDNSIFFDESLDVDLGHEDQSALVFNELVFEMGSGGSVPVFVLRFLVDGGDQYDFSEQNFEYSDYWTIDEIREETETIDPFVLSSEIESIEDSLSNYATKSDMLVATTHIDELSSSLSGTQIQMALYDGKFALPETVVEYYGGAVDLFDFSGHVNFDMLSTALGEYVAGKTVQRISFGTTVTDLSVGISYKYNVIVSGSTGTPEFQILDDEATINAKRQYLYNWFGSCNSIELPLTLQSYGFELGRYVPSSQAQELGNNTITKFDFKVDFGKWLHSFGDGIKPFAFTGMKMVKEISYPFATELTFGPHPFDYCNNLEIFDIRNVTAIGYMRAPYKVGARVKYAYFAPTIENVNPNLKIIVSDSVYATLMASSYFTTWQPYLVKASDWETVKHYEISSESWTFTLTDDTTVTKNVLIG